MSILDGKETSGSSYKLNRTSSKGLAALKEQEERLEREAHEERERHITSVLSAVSEKENQHYDERDVSLQPSFSKFQLPYFIKCRNRYNATKKLYEQRFQYEIEQLIAQQATGYEAARLNRHLCITTIWPPLHSRSEIVHTQRYFFSVTRKERKRLNWIMTTNII